MHSQASRVKIKGYRKDQINLVDVGVAEAGLAAEGLQLLLTVMLNTKSN